MFSFLGFVKYAIFTTSSLFYQIESALLEFVSAKFDPDPGLKKVHLSYIWFLVLLKNDWLAS